MMVLRQIMQGLKDASITVAASGKAFTSLPHLPLQLPPPCQLPQLYRLPAADLLPDTLALAVAYRAQQSSGG